MTHKKYKKPDQGQVENADKAEIKGLFAKNREVEFGNGLNEFFPKIELDCEVEARKEWEPKPELSPALEVFLGTLADIRELCWDMEFAGNSVAECYEEVVGYKNANENPYDGDETHEQQSLFEKEFNEDNEETKGERDTTTMVSERYTGAYALQNAYAMLIWSFGNLSPDEQEEMRGLYMRVKKRIILRAKENQQVLQIPVVWMEAGKVKATGFHNHKGYISNEDEKVLFSEKFGEDREINLFPPKYSGKAVKVKKDPETSARRVFSKKAINKTENSSGLAEYLISIIKNNKK